MLVFGGDLLVECKFSGVLLWYIVVYFGLVL